MVKGRTNPVFTLSSPAAGRNDFWDFIRGMAMLSVLLQHANVPKGNYILAFHMPFFFVLSGYIEFSRGKSVPFWTYLWGRVRRLIIPYFMFEALNLGLWQTELVLTRGWQDVPDAIKGILTVINTDRYHGLYGRLWFLPCMFVSDLLFFFVRKWFPESKAGLFASAGVLLGLSWITSKVLPGRLPFTADTALFAAVFLVLGYALGNQIKWLLSGGHSLWDLAIFGVSLLTLHVCIKSGMAPCLMYINSYGSYGTTVIAAISGTVAFFLLSKWCYAALKDRRLGKDLVLWYGRNSLATFPIHLMIKIYALRLSPLCGKWYNLLAIMLLLNIPIVNLITRYFPFMLGKLPVRKKASV